MTKEADTDMPDEALDQLLAEEEEIEEEEPYEEGEEEFTDVEMDLDDYDYVVYYQSE